MALLKLMLFAYLVVLLCGCVFSVVLFLFDVFRWHDREERVKIIPSNSPEESPDVVSEPDTSSDSEKDFDISLNESEVDNDA